jgi:hypothetical protein
MFSVAKSLELRFHNLCFASLPCAHGKIKEKLLNFGGFNMRKCFFALAVAALLVFPSFVSAQGQIAIESVNVSLWPEYDKAEMLVINSIELSKDTVFPVQLDVRIPANSVLHTVAVGNSGDAVSDQGIEKTTAKDGEWLVISIAATGSSIRIEYYDPGLKKDGDLRSYSYRWFSGYDVADFTAVFQEPFDATQFKSTLSLQDDGVHPDNMQYYFSSVGAVPAGKVFAFDLSYQKSTDALSVSRLEIQPVVVDENTPGRVSLNNYLPYIIGGLGVILIAGGLIYYRQSGRSGSKKSRRRQHARAESEENENGAYCAQCGTRAHGGDRFCRTCGSRIRKSEE